MKSFLKPILRGYECVTVLNQAVDLILFQINFTIPKLIFKYIEKAFQ